MHPVSEYRDLLKRIIAQAEQMVSFLPTINAVSRTEVIDFLKQYGCEGYPTNQVADFSIGPWLTRVGRPNTQHEGVTIIPCFSDDVPPVKLSDSFGLGQCLHTDQVILLYNVDHWSLAELALILLHEGRHARHRIGPRLAKLSPLDNDENLHETNTWLFMLNILVAWGGTVWNAAVQHEMAWLAKQRFSSDHPGKIIYDASNQYWPELDQLFGVTRYDQARQLRQRLVSLQANMLYWPQQDTSLCAEGVCHSLVHYFYH